MRKACPAVIVLGCLRTTRVCDRERDQFGGGWLVAGEANGEASAERLEMFQEKFSISQEEFSISAAAAEPHSIQ